MNTLEVRDLRFSYFRKPVLRGLHLQFSSGINVIVGENGGGKTTLFKILAGIYRPKGGQLLLNGKSLAEVPVAKRQIAYLPQDFQVYPTMKVNDFLKLICKVKGADDSERERVIEAADLSEFCDQKMKTLSGGMLRRVGIAQALIGKPCVIIADEPTAGLDPEQRLAFNRVLQRVAKETIVLLSTHIIEDIRDFYDRIIIFSQGESRFNGTYEQLMGGVACVELTERELTALQQEKIPCRASDRRSEGGETLYRTLLDKETAARRYPERQGPANLLEIWSYYNDRA